MLLPFCRESLSNTLARLVLEHLDELLLRAYSELSIHVAHVGSHGIFRNIKLRRNIGRGMPRTQQQKDFALTRGKPVLDRKDSTCAVCIEGAVAFRVKKADAVFFLGQLSHGPHKRTRPEQRREGYVDEIGRCDKKQRGTNAVTAQCPMQTQTKQRSCGHARIHERKQRKDREFFSRRNERRGAESHNGNGRHQNMGNKKACRKHGRINGKLREKEKKRSCHRNENIHQ